ncbi:CDP-alcohol phosphatidyltransferase family protein [Gimesia fumaroli]|uniref:Inner membrane protein YnbA n=1 Tax=Gimesia fumaroli TaxID=2527976 RepID=A0A518IJT8_9PLAN|nr:CDP-alcohol phosphatidyltransferase family protein [Gimesia fumaroli]QDV53366.1 Inner membrane protein YnbA [Gimesia fumaroli]
MASIYDLKPKFQGLLRPITRKLAAMKVTANQVTIAALLLSILVGLCIALFPGEKWPLLIVPLFLFIRMALNAIDGMLAREHNMKSDLGLILNEIGDVVADAAIYLPFALVPGLPAVPIVIIVLLAVISEMMGVVAVQIGVARRYEGPMGKSDRAFLFGLLGLLMGCGLQIGPWINYVLYVIVFLLVLTILNRARHALALKQSANQEN